MIYQPLGLQLLGTNLSPARAPRRWSPPTRLVPQGAALSRGPSSQSGSTSSRARGPRTRCGPEAHLETQHLLDPSRRLPREETRRFSRPLFFPHFLLRGQKSSPNMCVEVVHCVLKNCFAKVPLGLRRVVREHTVVGLHRCLYRHFVSSVTHAELLMRMDDRFLSH